MVRLILILLSAWAILTTSRSSYQTLLPLIIGLLGILGFGYLEFNFASEPIVDKRIFRTWTAISTYIQTMLHGLILWAAIYFLSKTTFSPSLVSTKLIIYRSLVLSSCKVILAGHFSRRPSPRNSGVIPVQYCCGLSHGQMEKVSLGTVGRMVLDDPWCWPVVSTRYRHQCDSVGFLKHTFWCWHWHALHSANPCDSSRN